LQVKYLQVIEASLPDQVFTLLVSTYSVFKQSAMQPFLQRIRAIHQSASSHSSSSSLASKIAAQSAVVGLAISLGLLGEVKPAAAATTTLSFNQSPTLVSGTPLSQGAVYRFPSVATGIDAMVEIETISNAQLKILDDNNTFPARFQPVIAPAAGALTNATSYIRFNFKLTPSTTASGTSFTAAPAAIATNVYFSAQDTDGNGNTNTIREFVEVIDALTTYIANPTLLQLISPPVVGGTGYEVANSTNVQSGIGTDDRYEIYSFLGASTSTFSIIGGNKTGSTGCTINAFVCDRQNSWTFNVSDVQKLDFGDAPSSFGDAFHAVPASPTVRLGASVDGDDGPNYTTAANGDGTDDDGIASFPTLTATSTNYSLSVTCAGNNAAVAGWIDFNKNNTFDVGERASGTCNGTSATLNWSGISGLTTGNTYARFRISSTASKVTSPTGQAFDGEVEDYQTTISAPSYTISGTVFEDPNYGGGAGRPSSTPTTSGRDGAIVELYDITGAYLKNTTTSGGGIYIFTDLAPGGYQVRVVNSTVTSSRPGYVSTLRPVQTFRTDASVTAGTVTAVTDRVGGENPAEIDAAANTTATLATLNAVTNQEVQSLTTVKVGSSNVSGVDFGYNFDTIVNTRDSGQGSLRQFITNSNQLSNAGLAQVGQTPGKEVSIFMIPNGAAVPGLRSGLTNQLTTYGAAKITLASGLTISDANTTLDGGTQTTNVGNTNNVTLGDTTTKIGIAGTTLSGVNGPEIEIAGALNPHINITGINTTVDKIAVLTTFAAGSDNFSISINANDAIIKNSLFGTTAANTNTPSNSGASAINISGSNAIVDRNLIRATYIPVFINRFKVAGITGIQIKNNEITTSRTGNAIATNACINFSDGIDKSAANTLIEGNFLHHCSWGLALDGDNTGTGTIIRQNTISNNTNAGVSTNVGENTHTVYRNVLTANGVGVLVSGGSDKVTISENSIFANTSLGIDLHSTNVYTGQGVTANDGVISASGGNKLIDYPIITSSSLSASTLILKGFVGNNPSGSTVFANATLEFFVADNDGNQNGEVIVGDGKSLPHGEGKTYLGTCTADGNGLFGTVASPCALTVPVGINPQNITSTATDTNGNTSEFSAAIASNPNILLVKRITRINASKTTIGGDDLASYVDTSSPYDDNVDETPPFAGQPDPAKDDTTYWPAPSSFLIGGVNGGQIKSGDEIEYTIYFLSTGTNTARNVTLCDRIPTSQIFVPGAFNSTPIAPGGSSSSDHGIAVSYNGTAYSYSNLEDGDAAQYYFPGTTLPGACGAGANTTGAVVVNLGSGATNATGGSLPNATAPGTPTTSYGWIRFRAKVE
jgi:hypothetical protein